MEWSGLGLPESVRTLPVALDLRKLYSAVPTIPGPEARSAHQVCGLGATLLKQLFFKMSDEILAIENVLAPFISFTAYLTVDKKITFTLPAIFGLLGAPKGGF